LIAISLEEGDQLRWVRRTRADNTIMIGSQTGMSIRFRTDNEQLRPMGRDTRGVRAMKLATGDRVVSMDILPAGLAEIEGEEAEEENGIVDATSADITGNETDEETLEACNDKLQGPWVLVVTERGFGKRVPVDQFRIQRRAGKGLRVTKFKTGQDQLTALRLVDVDSQLMIVTCRGIVMRQSTDAISCYSRSAKGVRLQRLDADDAIAAVTLVPQALEEEEEIAEVSEVTEVIEVSEVSGVTEATDE
jgi:DNA gyrase subunit A